LRANNRVALIIVAEIIVEGIFLLALACVYTLRAFYLIEVWKINGARGPHPRLAPGFEIPYLRYLEGNRLALGVQDRILANRGAASERIGSADLAGRFKMGVVLRIFLCFIPD